MKLFRIIITIMALSVSSAGWKAWSQEADYRFAVGAKLGMGGYLGEYGASNPFARPGFTGGFTGSYNLDVRWNFSANIMISSLSGNASKVSGFFPENINQSFSATSGEIYFRAEFNFLPYGIGETYKGLKRVTPYVAAGVGVIMAKPAGLNMTAAPELPLAVGARFKLKERLNIFAEVSFTKTFADGIDGADDIYGVRSSWFKNTDWTASLTVGLTYEFGKRCATCHYVD